MVAAEALERPARKEFLGAGAQIACRGPLIVALEAATVDLGAREPWWNWTQRW
jgi:hypothetical protein